MARKPKAAPPPKYLVLRDTGEHEGHGWTFPASDTCLGTAKRNLYSGDYSLEGYYDNKTFVIERKGSVSEFVANITQKEKWADFKDLLGRLEGFLFPFIVCEFPFSLIESYPRGSSIPPHLWDQIRVTPQYLVKRLWEIQLHFKTPILFCDRGGLAAASSLFKRIVEHGPQEPQAPPQAQAD